VLQPAASRAIVAHPHPHPYPHIHTHTHTPTRTPTHLTQQRALHVCQALPQLSMPQPHTHTHIRTPTNPTTYTHTLRSSAPSMSARRSLSSPCHTRRGAGQPTASTKSPSRCRVCEPRAGRSGSTGGAAQLGQGCAGAGVAGGALARKQRGACLEGAQDVPEHLWDSSSAGTHAHARTPTHADTCSVWAAQRHMHARSSLCMHTRTPTRSAPGSTGVCVRAPP